MNKYQLHEKQEFANMRDLVERAGSMYSDKVAYSFRNNPHDKEIKKVTFFELGEYKFKAMLEQLEKAEKFIFMEYFIVEEGYMWGRILDVLTRKAKEGVEVRVMYDGRLYICAVPAASASDFTARRQTKIGRTATTTDAV